MVILGASGSGKSALIELLIYFDIQKKCGVFAIDPHGDFVERIARLKLFNRKKYRDKLVYISFENGTKKIPTINPLENSYHKIKDYSTRQIAISGHAQHLTTAFENIFKSEFSHNMKTLVNYCLKLLLSRRESTLYDLLRLLQEETCQEYLKTAQNHPDEDLRNFFAFDFLNDSIYGKTKAAIRSRFRSTFQLEYIKEMFSAKRSTVNIEKMLNQGKVILVNASKRYLMDRDNVRFVGAFFTAEISRMAFNRASVPPEFRKQANIYIDEFQNFSNSQTEDLFAEARKYKIALCVAHQNLDQVDTKLQAVELGNTAIKLCGTVNAKDESTMSRNMKLEIGSIRRLERGKFALAIQGRNPIVIQSWSFLAKGNVNNNRYFNSEATWQKVFQEQQAKYYTDTVGLGIPENKEYGFVPVIEYFNKPKAA